MRLSFILLTSFCWTFAFASAAAQSPPVVNSARIVGVVAGDIVSYTFTQSRGTAPITWDNFAFVTYTPAFGATGNGPFFLATFDPDTQSFSWNSAGSPLGDYLWSVRANNAAGSSTGTLTVGFLLPEVPEPASLSLATLALMGLGGVARRR